jgi:non-specific protein-tyrosine kinase
MRPIGSELDLKMYGRILWQWAWLILLCLTVAGAAAYIVSLYTIPIYQATSTILIDEAQNPSGATYQDILTSERKARTYSEWMQRDQTKALVAQELGIDQVTLNEGITSIQVTPVRDTQLVQVEVEGIWPELVAAVADTLPQVFVREVIVKLQDDRYAELESSLLQQLEDLNSQIELAEIKIDDIGESRTATEEVELNRLRNELAQKQATRDSLRASLEDLRITKVQSSDTMIVVEQAKVPGTPVRPRVLINTLLAAIVGAMLALGLIFLIEYLDDRVKTPQEAIALAAVPMLGAIPRMPQIGRQQRTPDQALISFSHPRHPVTEGYRTLRTNLQFSSIDTVLDTLVVTSPNPGEGKTTTAANLAVVLAQAGKRVVLIDADLRRPKVHLAFNLPQTMGLTETLIAGTGSVPDFLHSTVVPNLWVITSGEEPPNPAELLGSQRLQHLLAELHQQADIVIIDAPPLVPVTDAQVLVGLVKNVVVVVKPGHTQRTALLRSLEALQHVGARVLGLVLNDVRRSAPGYYYAQYGEYYGEKSKASKKQPEVVPTTGESQRPAGLGRLLHKRETTAAENGLPAQPERNGFYQLQEPNPENQQ